MMLPYPMNGRWGYVDDHGRWQVEPVYSYAETFSDGLAIVGDKNGNMGAIDERGILVIPFVYNPLDTTIGLSVPLGEDVFRFVEMHCVVGL